MIDTASVMDSTRVVADPEGVLLIALLFIVFPLISAILAFGLYGTDESTGGGL